MSVEQNWIAILDFGSQYSQLIARRIREQKVYSELVRFDTPAGVLAKRKPSGIILSGGPASVLSPGSPLCDPAIYQLGVPVLGICYGMQMTAQLLGGSVRPGRAREYGSATIRIRDHASLFRDMPDELSVWMSHGDQVEKMPPGFRALADTDTCPVAAMGDPRAGYSACSSIRKWCTRPAGRKSCGVLSSRCAGARRTGRCRSFVQDSVDEIRRRVGENRVLCALSGGVDSSVVAALIHRAIGRQLHCVFVDNGLLRAGEREKVEKTFGGMFGMDLKAIDAGRLFLDGLKGVTDPEAKRKIIGRTFIDVFAEEARRLGDNRFLAQGTLYPDVIESASPIGGPSATIKSHHNVGGLPTDLKFELIEPIRWLFKDEVRLVGREMGLPDDIILRQPFPGPGLAVRILGEVTAERVALLQQADLRVQEEMTRWEGFRTVWQSFAILLPVQTVGVMGDSRTYENVVALRIVESQDGMTADWSRVPYGLLARISNRIINEVAGINRVVYDISSKPPATIEWE